MSPSTHGAGHRVVAAGGHPRARVDAVFFVAAGLAALLLAYLLAREGLTVGYAQIWLYLVFWPVLAYAVLPRIHVLMTGIYLPDYFVGRTRTSDGLLADPVNLGLLGSAGQIHGAMLSAGWILADKTTVASARRIVHATLRGQSYAAAPVSPLILFGRPHDFCYQKEVDGSPMRRHHVRFWRCPPGWQLPGGREVDWFAAATYDRSVGLSLFTLQVTHRISHEIDAERDHVVATLRVAVPQAGVSMLQRFSAEYRGRSGGGDAIETDGHLAIIDLRGVVDPTLREQGAPREPSHDRGLAPPAVLAGSVLLLTRAVVEIVAILPGSAPGILPGLAEPPWPPVAAVATLSACLGLAVLARSDRARLAGMDLAMLGVGVSTAVHFATGRDSTIDTDLIGLSLDILILVTLSSATARTWTRRTSTTRLRS